MLLSGSIGMKGGWRWSPSLEGEWEQETTAIELLCARAPAHIPTGLSSRYILCDSLANL